MDIRDPIDDEPGASAVPTVTRSPIEDFMFDVVARNRMRKQNRFQGPYNAGRLIALGVVVIDLAAIAIADEIFGGLIIDYRPGMASLFAGILFSFIAIRLGRPAVFLDWITNGILHVCLGLTLINDADLSSPWAAIGFHAILMGYSLAPLWIGVTLPIRKGRPSFVAGGLASLIVAVYAIIDHLAIRAVSPDVILATVLLILGMSTISFGSCLSKRT